jgi:hypothetical protein
MSPIHEHSTWMNPERVASLVAETLEPLSNAWPHKTGRVLLVLPERQRLWDKVAPLAQIVHAALIERRWQVAIVIARYPGEQPLSLEERAQLLPTIPAASFIDTADLRQLLVGEVPADIVRAACGGLIEDPLPLSLPELFNAVSWDGVINLEAVVPNDLLGFTGPPQNRWLGLAGREFLNAASRIALLSGWENNVANLVAPLRQCLFWADKNLWPANLPRLDFAVVWGNNFRGERAIIGYYAGAGDESYLQAALLSRQHNVAALDEGLQRVVVLFPGLRFASLWDVQQLLPRLVMSLAEGGELILLTPGIERLAGDDAPLAVYRRTGYLGAAELRERQRTDPELGNEPWLAAHLIHGSTSGRSRIYHAIEGIDAETLRALNLWPAEQEDALFRYRPGHAKAGWNITNEGERYFFIPDPTAGLWSTKKRLQNRLNEFARRMFNQ